MGLSRLFLLDALKIAVIAIFDGIFRTASKVGFEEFPLTTVFIDELAQLEVFLDGPIVGLDSRS